MRAPLAWAVAIGGGLALGTALLVLAALAASATTWTTHSVCSVSSWERGDVTRARAPDVEGTLVLRDGEATQVTLPGGRAMWRLEAEGATFTTTSTHGRDSPWTDGVAGGGCSSGDTRTLSVLARGNGTLHVEAWRTPG